VLESVPVVPSVPVESVPDVPVPDVPVPDVPVPDVPVLVSVNDSVSGTPYAASSLKLVDSVVDVPVLSVVSTDVVDAFIVDDIVALVSLFVSCGRSSR